MNNTKMQDFNPLNIMDRVRDLNLVKLGDPVYFVHEGKILKRRVSAIWMPSFFLDTVDGMVTGTQRGEVYYSFRNIIVGGSFDKDVVRDEAGEVLKIKARHCFESKEDLINSISE